MQRSVSLANIGEPPVSLLQAKAWLRVDHADDDDTIRSMILEAVSEVERRTGRLLRTATATLTLDRFPGKQDNGLHAYPRRREPIALPFPAFRTLTSCEYKDTAGTVTPLTVTVITKHCPVLVFPQTNDWPETQTDNPQAVMLVYECGAAPDATQQELIGCMRLMLELAYHDLTSQEMARYEHRRDSILHRWKLRDNRLAGITYA